MRHAVLLLLCTIAMAAVEVQATVVRVIDGDTIETESGRVRLLYIDTPESKGNGHGEAKAEGKAASAFLAALLPIGATVSLWSPKPVIQNDRYGRALAVVWKHEVLVIGAGDNQGTATDVQVNVNLAIVRAGWSPYWKKYGAAPLNSTRPCVMPKRGPRKPRPEHGKQTQST